MHLQISGKSAKTKSITWWSISHHSWGVSNFVGVSIPVIQHKPDINIMSKTIACTHCTMDESIFSRHLVQIITVLLKWMHAQTIAIWMIEGIVPNKWMRPETSSLRAIIILTKSFSNQAPLDNPFRSSKRTLYWVICDFHVNSC